jgi:hypothetical protein
MRRRPPAHVSEAGRLYFTHFVSASNRWDAFWRWEVIRHDPDLVISKERQRLRNLFPVAQDFSLALERTKALSV